MWINLEKLWKGMLVLNYTQYIYLDENCAYYSFFLSFVLLWIVPIDNFHTSSLHSRTGTVLLSFRQATRHGFITKYVTNLQLNWKEQIKCIKFVHKWNMQNSIFNLETKHFTAKILKAFKTLLHTKSIYLFSQYGDVATDGKVWN